jgi:hypothetical protein
MSEINLALYRTFAQPIVRAMTTTPMAEWTRRLHAQRLQYELLSDDNPLMGVVAGMAKSVRQARQPVGADNPFLKLQEAASRQVVASLDAWREATESFAERMFLSVYGSPVLQAVVGIDPTDTRPLRKAGKSPLHCELVQSRIAELKSRISTGGLRECLVRSMLYVGMALGGPDERGFAAIRRLRAVKDDKPRPTLAEFKALVREQYFMLLIDEEATLANIPDLLPAGEESRHKAFIALRTVLSAPGEISGEAAKRLQRIAGLFGVDSSAVSLADPRAAKSNAKAA